MYEYVCLVEQKFEVFDSGKMKSILLSSLADILYFLIPHSQLIMQIFSAILFWLAIKCELNIDQSILVFIATGVLMEQQLYSSVLIFSTDSALSLIILCCEPNFVHFQDAKRETDWNNQLDKQRNSWFKKHGKLAPILDKWSKWKNSFNFMVSKWIQIVFVCQWRCRQM
ncbi:Hypothetical_protein [Hexamita inflata]|uniref:Hypothetical_protein n=1 Tax=Hexamita inflata TaxID=28002 RepID=A0AA86TSE7_9EUKA|nr:Hypothetical protein HINF_LOCUS14789 [Hexamita inflata]